MPGSPLTRISTLEADAPALLPKKTTRSAYSNERILSMFNDDNL